MTVLASSAGTGATLAGTAELRPAQFRDIAAIMQREARIHLVEAKMTLVHSRLSRRLREHGLSSFVDYVSLVQRDAEERHAMVVALTTNHTHFFRENHHFDHLRREVLPQLQDRARKGEKVRIWSAGCSSGEEVYSIAMCLAGDGPTSAAWLQQGDVRLLATDIAPHVVQSVQDARYSAATVEPVPESYRRRWMRAESNGDHVVVEPLRELVAARVLNLFEPWPMRRKYDVIFCRNVMIYFDDTAKAELEARFVEMLAPGGYLYIGHSERLIGPAARQMKPVGQTIYARNDGGAA
ncbi:CheR family methyltransferase [Novosphingobium sp.]|jgi:chemotaxis protein methyltransferase CheR|uniref:CheR family methyltransferase n=1 Tax=Novosphingobium sp. TaxID=1874826 RepID=UPI0028AE3D44|nr:CheR family methyltransferase [Novosphingobium sp.]